MWCDSSWKWFNLKIRRCRWGLVRCSSICDLFGWNSLGCYSGLDWFGRL